MSLPFTNKKIIKENRSLQIQPNFTPYTGEGTSGSTCSGSITVEAAFVLVLFLFFYSAVLTLFPAMQIALEIQAAMEGAAEEISIMIYGLDQLEEGVQESQDGDWQESLRALAGRGITELYIRGKIVKSVGEERLNKSCIRGGSSGISLAGSALPNDQQVIDLCISYRISFPLFSEGVLEIPIRQRVYRRAWLGTGQTASAEDPESEAGIVYVTENGTVYHVSEACTHLRLSTRIVSRAEVSSYRSNDGSKYYPCERCAKYAGETVAVYITEEGNRYHTDLSCGGLKRTVTAVSKENTSLPACSRCGGG